MNKASAASSILSLVGGALRGAAPLARASVWVCFTATPGIRGARRASRRIQLNVCLNATGTQGRLSIGSRLKRAGRLAILAVQLPGPIDAHDSDQAPPQAR